MWSSEVTIIFLFLSPAINFTCASIFSDLEKCVIPPLQCPNANITFWLYTRINQDRPHKILASDGSSITSAPRVKDAPIKIMIHGYNGNKNGTPNDKIRPEYMDCCNYNIISVDYSPIAIKPCYFQAAQNTELVGMCTAQLVDQLVSKHDFLLERFHVIGFSLGGHVAGFIANYLKSGQLNRITALDPALPLFVTNDVTKKIDRTDAKFVDVLHTDALGRGKIEASGHVDFYANGGREQPGCSDTSEEISSYCNHDRATQYYAESVSTSKGFYSTKCSMWNYLMDGCEASSNDNVLFGEYVPHEPLIFSKLMLPGLFLLTPAICQRVPSGSVQQFERFPEQADRQTKKIIND